MGGTKKGGRGGGGGGKKGRNCRPQDRVAVQKQAGAPGRDLTSAGQRMGAMRERQMGRDPALKRAAAKMEGKSGSSALHAMALSATQRQAFHKMVASSEAAAAEDGATAAAGADVSLRRFFKDFKKVIDQSDVLLEVVDARDPAGCRLHHFEKAIASQFGTAKTIIVVLNKIDLLPEHPPEPLVRNPPPVGPDGSCGNAVADAWIGHLAHEGIQAVPFTTKKNRGSDHAVQHLFRTLRSISRGEEGHHKALTVGVIGYPNVGKSSLINALKGKQVVGVGNTPGFTTANTEVTIRGDVRIVDCPGVVMPGDDTGDIVLRNATKVTGLADPLAAVRRLLSRCDPQQLAGHYMVPPPSALAAVPQDPRRVAEEFSRDVAIRRGRVRQGGDVDLDGGARLVLQDWNDGRIGYYTLPGAQGLLTGGLTLIDAEKDQTAVTGSLTSKASELPSFHLKPLAADEDDGPVEWAADARPQKKKMAKGVKHHPMDTTDEDDDEDPYAGIDSDDGIVAV